MSHSKSKSTDRDQVANPSAARLIMLAGGLVGRRYAVGELAEIGRAPDCQVPVDHPGVSRRHALVSQLGDGFEIRDLGSSNGTYVNDVRIDRAPLAYGDRIKLGSGVVLAFSRHDPVEQEILQRQRFELMGRLGAGVAHDLNNLLGVMLASLEYVRAQPEVANREIRECIDDIEMAARRAAGLTPRLLELTRAGGDEHRRLDLSQVCHEIARLARRTIGRNIQIETHIAPNIEVLGDVVELHQLLMNLCLNARDAMPEGGVLELALATVPQSADDSVPAPAEAAMLRVRDTGCGIDPALMGRVFEPFFSTKGAARGSGLGLASAKDIAMVHGADLTVESEVGKGTMFCLRLPLAPASKRSRMVTGRLPDLSGLLKPARILLVDDEDMVRRALGRILRLDRHTVIEARDGREALQHYRKGEQRPDMVLLDLDMPKLGGEQTLALLKKIDPGAKVLLLTGHAEPERERALVEHGAMGVLRKPCSSQQLLEEVSRVLFAAGEIDESSVTLGGRH